MVPLHIRSYLAITGVNGDGVELGENKERKAVVATPTRGVTAASTGGGELTTLPQQNSSEI